MGVVNRDPSLKANAALWGGGQNIWTCYCSLWARLYTAALHLHDLGEMLWNEKWKGKKRFRSLLQDHTAHYRLFFICWKCSQLDTQYDEANMSANSHLSAHPVDAICTLGGMFGCELLHNDYQQVNDLIWMLVLVRWIYQRESDGSTVRFYTVKKKVGGFMLTNGRAHFTFTCLSLLLELSLHPNWRILNLIRAL